jgi:hypothetical protein
MERILNFEDAEIATVDDFDRFGTLARESIDHIVGDAVGHPGGWAGFPLTRVTAVDLSVGAGRYFKGDKVYSTAGGETVSLDGYRPLTSGVGKYVALILRGRDATTEETRQFERDADADQLVSQNTIKILSRAVSVLVQQGPEAITPIRPSIAADDCCIAFVRLTSTGFVDADIERYEPHRLKNLREVEARVSSTEAENVKTNLEVASHKTDISNLSARISTIPRPEVIYQLQRDNAVVRRKLQLPDEARASFYDPFLVPNQSATLNAAYLARIREGIRFPNAAEREAPIELQVPDSPTIRVASGMVMPAWTERAAIVVEGGTGEKAISQIVHQVVTPVQRQISRSSVSYGPIVQACENVAEWAALRTTYPGQMLSHSGETFQVVGLADHYNNTVPEYEALHQVYDVQQVSYSSWTETYWDYITEEVGVNGSIYGQTFLNARPCIATSLDLEFSQVDTTGDVTIIIGEVNIVDAPDLRLGIIQVTVPANQLKKGWNNIPFRPSLLTAGKRYFWATITSGNHRLKTVSGNKFAQGTLFYSTDASKFSGGWFQGALEEDFHFRLNVAQFASTRVEVPMKPMTLENGIAGFRALYGGWTPGGTSQRIEIQVNDAWFPLAVYEVNPLMGLPALVQWRIVFSGTTDLMPAINLVDAKITTQRPRNDMRWISKTWSFGLSTTQVVMETTVDSFDPNLHTVINRLMDGTSVLTPATTTPIQDPNKPSRWTYRSVFNLGSAKTGTVLRIEGDTDLVTAPYFVENLHAYVL